MLALGRKKYKDMICWPGHTAIRSLTLSPALPCPLDRQNWYVFPEAARGPHLTQVSFVITILTFPFSKERQALSGFFLTRRADEGPAPAAPSALWSLFRAPKGHWLQCTAPTTAGALLPDLASPTSCTHKWWPSQTCQLSCPPAGAQLYRLAESPVNDLTQPLQIISRGGVCVQKERGSWSRTMPWKEQDGRVVRFWDQVSWGEIPEWPLRSCMILNEFLNSSVT